MAQLVVGGPLGEADLRDQLGPDPVRTLVGQDLRRERRRLDLARLQQLREPRQLRAR